MRIVLIHPNYHSGGAEIAGNWPPAWAAYLTGALKSAGYTDVRFIDAMTNNLTDEQLSAQLAEAKPDIVGATCITPSIYKAERALQIAKQMFPSAVTILGGIHATFMYQQVLSEAPWIDVIVRGEGEEILVELVQAIDRGRWPLDRHSIKGLAFLDGTQIVASPAAATVKNLDAITPDWGILEWSKYKYIPLNCRVAIPSMARGCPFTCSFCSQWKFWRDYRIRDPKKVAEEIQELHDKYDVKFFILADEEPTINRKKFIQFCEELIARGLHEKVLWGINTRVTDILRDVEYLPLYRKAGLIHVSLGTEAAAQLKLDRFNKETKVAGNKRAIQLLREAGIVVEAQFIVGLENETKETLEETYRMSQDCWRPGPSCLPFVPMPGPLQAPAGLPQWPAVQRCSKSRTIRSAPASVPRLRCARGTQPCFSACFRPSYRRIAARLKPPARPAVLPPAASKSTGALPRLTPQRLDPFGQMRVTARACSPPARTIQRVSCLTMAVCFLAEVRRIASGADGPPVQDAPPVTICIDRGQP